jgi:hypothetical protein
MSCVEYTSTERKSSTCYISLINFIVEQQDVSSTPGPGENHVTNEICMLVEEALLKILKVTLNTIN